MNIKKIILSFVFFIGALSYAQNGINYKAIIKDANGNILANTSITVQFNIYEGSALTNNVYRELHGPTTDGNGLIIVNIGEGTTTDVFTDINWSNDSHYLNVELDTGNGFVDFGTTQFKTVPYASVAENVSGLETINEGNGTGWRLVGSDPDNFGTIGSSAIDLSLSNLNSTTYGATGPNSVTMGLRTTASGDSSLALGSDSTASDDFSTAIGAGVTASGGSSTALGVGSQATENSSTAIGYITNASGFASTALGYFSEASGSYATAIGNNTSAEAFNSVAIGRYNLGGGNPALWSGNDPLFEIGNGTSNANRNNALTVYKNGYHAINSTSIGLRINSDTFGLYIPNSGNDALYILSPEDRGIFIENPGSNGIEINNPDNGIVITNAQDDGIEASGDDRGGSFYGDNAGVYASGGSLQSDVPDLILGSSNNSAFSDDGIISTNPNRLGSDMFLRSYDAVVVQLDYDGNENGNFRVRNSNQDVVFDVNENGFVTLGNILRIGSVDIERAVVNSFDFLSMNSGLMPNEDGEYLLGTSANRWINLWAVDGTINTSDRREKKNIKDLSYGLAEVLQMQPVSFNWKNKNNQDTKLGLIAQDLQTLIPEVVKSHTWKKDKTTGVLSKKELERLGVYYSDLVPVLIKAIQEQQLIIETLNAKNGKQASKLENIEQNYKSLLSRIEQIESKSSN